MNGNITVRKLLLVQLPLHTQRDAHSTTTCGKTLHRQNWFIVWEIQEIFLSSFLSEQLMQRWLGTVWNWSPNTIIVKTEMKLKLRTKFHLHWSVGLSTTVECQTFIQLVPLPKHISAKIIHLSRCRLSFFGVSCSHSQLQWVLRALWKWSRKKLGHETWTWSIDASEAHQPPDFPG